VEKKGPLINPRKRSRARDLHPAGGRIMDFHRRTKQSDDVRYFVEAYDSGRGAEGLQHTAELLAVYMIKDDVVWDISEDL